MGRIELEVPTGSSIRSLGLRPSAFVDIGSVFMLDQPRRFQATLREFLER